MKWSGLRISVIALLALLLLGGAIPGTHAAPLPFEVACLRGSLHFWRLILNCDGELGWCWSGWEYIGHDGGLDHYGCGHIY